MDTDPIVVKELKPFEDVLADTEKSHPQTYSIFKKDTST